MTLLPKQEQFRQRVTSKWLFKFFLLQKMPIALLAGVRVRALNAESAVVSIPYKWLSQNPFRSVYFATQAMAAEMSTGVIGTLAAGIDRHGLRENHDGLDSIAEIAKGE